MIKYLLLLLAIPTGILLAKINKDESQIYSSPQYFPLIKKIFLITAAITFSQNEQIFLTSLFILITIQAWQRA